MKITVLGDGGWGTTLAILLNNNKYSVTIWSVFEDYAQYLDKHRQNPKFLPGIKIPKKIKITSDLKVAVNGAGLIVLAVPSQYMRSVLKKLEPAGVPGSVPFLSVSKGVEDKTLLRMSEVIEDVLGKRHIAVLSGPTISYEVARQLPTTVVAASKNPALAKKIQGIFNTPDFRIYTSSDVIGVELGGSLKNVIAIAAGALDGFGLEANTKAGLITRGLAEISRLGVAMGAKRETFFGVSGLGDLVTTCISEHGRNRWFGEEIGKGKKPKDILKKTDMVVEGIVTARSAYQLSKKYRVEMPIIKEVYAVLYQNKSPRQAVEDLMTREKKEE